MLSRLIEEKRTKQLKENNNRGRGNREDYSRHTYFFLTLKLYYLTEYLIQDIRFGFKRCGLSFLFRYIQNAQPYLLHFFSISITCNSNVNKKLWKCDDSTDYQLRDDGIRFAKKKLSEVNDRILQFLDMHQKLKTVKLEF